MHIKPVYKTNSSVTAKSLYEHKFRRTINGDIVYRFIVYKYSGRPLIFCDFTFYEDENQIHINVADVNGNTYNFNKEEYGKSDVIKIINNCIQKELNNLITKGVIVK